MSFQILPELVSGRGTAGRWWRGSGMAQRLAISADTLPLHHPLRGRSPSPCELGEDFKLGHA